MCGIFGGVSIGFLSYTALMNIKQLGIMSQLRGADSTGIIVVRKKKGRNKKIVFETKKGLGNSSNFLERKDVSDAMTNINTFCVVGHARKATVGAINETNAHPIEIGSIIAVHNGTINHFRPNKIDEDTRTDSLGLIERIARDGIDSAISEIGDGAYALVYVDRAQRTLNFARNYQRPLFKMWNKDKTTLYWASEKGFLDLLREREGTGLFCAPETFPLNTLQTIQLGSLGFKDTSLPIPRSASISNPYFHDTTYAAPIIRPLALPPPPKPYKPVICGTCTKPISECSCAWRHKTSVPVITKTHNQKMYRGWDRKNILVGDVTDLLKYGCCMCSVPQKPEIAVMWVTPHTVVCDHCLKDTAIYQYIRESYPQMHRGCLLDGEYSGQTMH